MEEYFIKKNVNSGLAKFLAKNIPDQSTFLLVEYLLDNGIKQNILQYFLKKNLFLHPNCVEMTQYLIMMKDYSDFSIFYLYGCSKMKNVKLLFELVNIFSKTNISGKDVKSLIKNFIGKIEKKNLEKISFAPFLLEIQLHKIENINFSLMTKILHKTVDVLEKSSSLEQARMELGF